ncbi:segregation and condensation protein A [Alicyclobacillus fodiniaquatilis]|jgi:segregation and condensation protein A|uniref:Segregation and condensation protein A n=1 Tax=Alicyclobacillus fodiniaquatilis TaxID=1661150 RepID=A0ABW4JI55_9BACL
MQRYEIKLAQFEGPLDLLLHLIRKNEVDIHDIPIAEITDQYLEYLRAMEEWSLDIASEFVVMAATLLAIKSRMLLPRQKTSVDEEEDPRAPLVEQLIEYERCKWAAMQLSDMANQQAQVYSRAPMDLTPFKRREVPELTGVSLWNLVDAFRKLYARMPKTQQVAEIRGHVERVEDIMAELEIRLSRYRRILFEDLFDFAKTRHALVSAFLAILELVKDKKVECIQEEPFSVLELVWTGGDGQ